jgi:hemoglobin-like flavoprotein
MTPTQITLVQNSWRLIRDLDPQLVGDLFYSKLFLDHPELRSLFPTDMSDQHGKLIATFNILIARLDHLADLMSDITALAISHVKYGVKPEHYDAVGSALLWTLARGLGDDWTPEVSKSWQTCYADLSAVMIQASEK